MNEWWDSLNGWQQFFWTVAIFSSLLQAFFFIASLIGGGDFDHGDADAAGGVDFGSGDADAGGDTDLDSDGGDGVDGHEDVSHGVKILSVRAMVAFGVGFGWAGVLGLSNGWTLGAALLGGLAFGLVFLFAIYFIMRFLMAMQDPGGGLDYWNAVGKRGHAYFTIPGARMGEGQIEILLQGRLITANAVTEHPDSIPPRAPVTVLSVEGENLFVVEPDTVRDHLISGEA
jgi:membrane protein implicated in regulation of membrane protease activity